ncbi:MULTISPECIES: protein arginine kinase [unclassified Exiguobacterium]|uniref:protein arginine kinase n=1 Tax=unclassified Exiguobacterium TaxID=2644629 RepID=UPI000B58AEDD|nr:MULTISPECIES: protein arginine kinase [unclassified Exiguobacterium]ASI34102.1 ATP--guanido phosphotransferase [Exiguobacterium sp. N4-1P]ASI37094.1 ATP--guanido phosphotransferase [Exiguobacterium sp. N4-1P]
MFKELLTHPLSEKMNQQAPYDDIVVSTRIRLARNAMQYPFSTMLSEKEANELIDETERQLSGLKGFRFGRVDQADALTRTALVEKHLISPALASHPRTGLFISEDEQISVMVNEEDHFRIQTLFPGLQLEEAFRIAKQVDQLISERFKIAFDDALGYLTTCPSNVGTGLRASVMLHLPGLVLTNQIQGYVKHLRQLGFAIRGRYGEGSDASGRMFQLSNQRTLGASEDMLITDYLFAVEALIEAEQAARKGLMEMYQEELEDRLYRSYGILTSARLITAREATERLSDVRLADGLGLAVNLAPNVFHHLLVSLQTGFLQKHFGNQLTTRERDIERANVIRQMLTEQKHRDHTQGGFA